MIEKFKIVLVSLLFTFLCVEKVSGYSLNMDVFKVESIQETQKKEKMNDSILYSLLIKNNVLFPEIVIAQAKLETGNYTSNLCVNWHNLFGIKLNGKYAHFSSFEASVIAYRDKVQYKLKPNEDYYHFLKRIGYASNPNYVSKVKTMVKQVSVKS